MTRESEYFLQFGYPQGVAFVLHQNWFQRKFAYELERERERDKIRKKELSINESRLPCFNEFTFVVTVRIFLTSE